MSKRTKVYNQLTWVGGLNSAADSGFIPDSDLVVADNVVFSTSGARKKRQGFSYLDSAIPAPNFRSSSGTTRTLRWTTNSIQIATPQNDILVNGEKITLTTTASGNEASYAASTVAISSLTNIAEVTSVQCVADVSGSLNNKYFYLYSAEDATLHVPWFNVNSAGTAPSITGATLHEVALSTNDSASTVASSLQSVLDALSDFGASVSTDTVTITNAATGICTNASDAGSTGFTISTTTEGGHTITYTATGSLSESSTAVSAITIVKAYKLVNLTDYWRLDASSVKQQLIMAVSDEFKLYRFSSVGSRQEVSGTGGPATAPTRVNSVVLNDKCIFSFDTLTDKAIKYDPDSSSSYAALGGSPPDFFAMQTYLGRLWTNDKTNPDRLHYSSTGNPEEWNGAGDSGAIDISVGDGDSVGVTGIFVYKNLLYVAKRDSLFRVVGNAPENFKIEDVSKGIGIESQSSIAYIDQDDVSFVSTRGIHSASATDRFGDVESEFLSYKIQPTFDDFSNGRLKHTQSVFHPEFNSIVFSVTENASSQNALYLYNIIEKAWYRWPDINCNSIAIRKLSDKKQLLIGNSNGRVITTQNGTYKDYGSEGITYKVKSGTIYPDKAPLSWKGFKRLYLYFRPRGKSNFTVKVKIDNQATQSFFINPGQGSDLLGQTFVLGTSTLGTSDVLAPHAFQLEGHGRGFTLEIEQSGPDESIEFYGFSVEYEAEGPLSEVIT